MKKVYIVLLLSLVFSVYNYSQSQVIPQVIPDTLKFTQNIEGIVGYIPNPDYQAVKTGIGYNNIGNTRWGAYTTTEFGINKYFCHIIGGSYAIVPKVFIYGGVDWFTSHGVFTQGFKGCRKEVGADFSFSIIKPDFLPKGVLRLGYSFKAGFTFGFGYRFSL